MMSQQHSVQCTEVVLLEVTRQQNQTRLRRRAMRLTARFPVSSRFRPSPDRGDPGCCCRRPSQRREGQRGGPAHADSTGGRALQHRPRPGVEGRDGHPAQQQPQGESDAPGLDRQTSFQRVLQLMLHSRSFLERRRVKRSSRKMEVVLKHQ